MTRPSQSDLHGILVIDKPEGITSHDVVDRLRKLTGIRRIGHAGTLDPFATGVLVTAVGKATRLLRYISDARKRYIAEVLLGYESDTGDPEGTLVKIADVCKWPEICVIEDQLKLFTGTISQTPPAYSAIRIDGKHAYDRVRAGEEVNMPTREVHVYSLQIDEYSAPHLCLDIECGSGTYIRSIARDLGAALGTGGYCRALRRTQVGNFTLSQALKLDELQDIDLINNWSQVALDSAAAVADFEVVTLSDKQSSSWLNGNRINTGTSASDALESVRVYSCTGQFLGVGRFEDQTTLIPTLVFNVSD